MDEMTTHEPIADEDTPATATQEHAPTGDTPNGGPVPEGTSNGGPATEESVREALKHVMDPELGVNIVDLGLVYKCETEPIEGGEKVKVEFTLTAPGCGMGDFLRQDVEQKLLALPGVKEADVQVVLDPAWDQSMMSDAARLQLGLM